METDIERGLERTGGTSTVDDLVLSPYFQASYRVRDAVIVSKAWREGASPTDARTAYNLTKTEYSHTVNRVTTHMSNLDSISFDSKSSYHSQYNNIWERVLWTDDTDFALIRCPCPSLDGGFIRGFDIFTLGDCQSILLKLTNEYCEVSGLLYVSHNRQRDESILMINFIMTQRSLITTGITAAIKRRNVS